MKELVYAGFTIDLIGAAWSHAAVGDYGSLGFIGVITALLAASYILLRRLQNGNVFQNSFSTTNANDNKPYRCVAA